ncbi:MAG: cell division protein ZapD [Saezia sp.]
MILYEHPFNERIRTWLRLERLFIYLGTLIKREDQVDHHYALHTLFELMDIASRSDLRIEILTELSERRRIFESLRTNPEISEVALNRIIEQLQACTDSLNDHGALKITSDLEAHSWLMSIRKRMSIPGGTCEFDLPTYHAWLHFPAKERLAHLYGWVAQLAPLADAVTNLLRLLRDSATLKKTTAPKGKLELHLPQNKSFSMLRVMVDTDSSYTPEISANQLLISMRWMQLNEDWKQVPITSDVHFQLALCA